MAFAKTSIYLKQVSPISMASGSKQASGDCFGPVGNTSVPRLKSLAVALTPNVLLGKGCVVSVFCVRVSVFENTRTQSVNLAKLKSFYWRGFEYASS